MFPHPTHRVCPPSQCTVIDELHSLQQGPYRGEKTLSLFSVWLPKTAIMANKNTARGNQMATRTAAPIVVWNISHDEAQDGTGELYGWHNNETER